jgi:hypothetical protein
LTAALSDRCRPLRQIAAGAKVEGRSQLAEIAGAWAPCRLVPTSGAEAEDPGRGRRAILARAQLVIAPVNLSGEPVEIRASDRLEVQGRGTWNVVAEPEAATHRRTVAYVVTVERLAEPVREAV